MQSAVQCISSQSNGAVCQGEDGALIISMKNDTETLFENPGKSFMQQWVRPAAPYPSKISSVTAENIGTILRVFKAK